MWASSCRACPPSSGTQPFPRLPHFSRSFPVSHSFLLNVLWPVAPAHASCDLLRPGWLRLPAVSCPCLAPITGRGGGDSESSQQEARLPGYSGQGPGKCLPPPSSRPTAHVLPICHVSSKHLILHFRAMEGCWELRQGYFYRPL